MKKKIAITSLITIVILLSIYAFIWGVGVVCFPKVMGNFYKGLNDYDNAFKYYEIDYRRHPDLDRLENLVQTSFFIDNDSKTEKYGEKLLKDEEYNRDYNEDFYLLLTCKLIKKDYKDGEDNLVENALDYTLEYSANSGKLVNIAGLDYALANDNLEYFKQNVSKFLDFNALTTLINLAHRNSNQLILEGIDLQLQQILADFNESDKEKSIYITIDYLKKDVVSKLESIKI